MEATFIVEDVLAISVFVVVVFAIVVKVSAVDNSAVLDDCRVVVSIG